jgi:hypothetical protein
MSTERDDAWGDAVVSLAEPRTEKPRRTGITALIDKGLGLRATDDLIEMAAPLVDHVKLGFGTTAGLSAGFLRRKIARLVEAGIVVYPGGTLLEAAWAGADGAFIPAHALGSTGLEVSDGTVDLPAADAAGDRQPRPGPRGDHQLADPRGSQRQMVEHCLDLEPSVLVTIEAASRARHRHLRRPAAWSRCQELPAIRDPAAWDRCRAAGDHPPPRATSTSLTSRRWSPPWKFCAGAPLETPARRSSGRR